MLGSIMYYNILILGLSESFTLYQISIFTFWADRKSVLHYYILHHNLGLIIMFTTTKFKCWVDHKPVDHLVSYTCTQRKVI